MNVKFTIFYSLNCCIRIILYTGLLHAIVFFVLLLFCTLYFMVLCFFFTFLSQFIYSYVLSSVFYTINVNDFLLVGHCKYSSVLYHFRVIRR